MRGEKKIAVLCNFWDILYRFFSQGADGGGALFSIISYSTVMHVGYCCFTICFFLFFFGKKKKTMIFGLLYVPYVYAIGKDYGRDGNLHDVVTCKIIRYTVNPGPLLPSPGRLKTFSLPRREACEAQSLCHMIVQSKRLK